MHEQATPRTFPQAQRFNALRHGLRAQSILLPRDDGAVFEAWRHSAYAHYRPLTPEEDRCVERIVACEWRMERWQRWERKVNSTLDDLMEEAPDGPTAQHHNPDMHHWQHRAIDCTIQEGRLERSLIRAERRLFELQRMRRNRLLAPARAADTGADAAKDSMGTTGGLSAEGTVADAATGVHPADQAGDSRESAALAPSGSMALPGKHPAGACSLDRIGNLDDQKKMAAVPQSASVPCDALVAHHPPAGGEVLPPRTGVPQPQQARHNSLNFAADER